MGCVYVGAVEKQTLHRTRGHGVKPSDQSNARRGALKFQLDSGLIRTHGILMHHAKTEHVDVKLLGNLLIADGN